MTFFTRTWAEYLGIRSVGYIRPKHLKFYAQISQDRFVYNLLYGLLDKRDRGYYLEIGAGEPRDMSNSYFFERYCQWRGLSIDIIPELPARWCRRRKNTLLIEDALKVDYSSHLRNFPRIIDYLSLDVDDYYDEVLKKLPFHDYTFKVITIEHDAYRYGDVYKDKERDILSSFGYQLLCPNVSKRGACIEDWWIHPGTFSCHLPQMNLLDLNSKDHSYLLEEIEKISK